ncbi:MAG: hypothetical protein HC841_06830 [Verrucomicrobiae bacterium]|nr:hypothetical protein [Verrucomicrobiae bacterium]
MLEKLSFENQVNAFGGVVIVLIGVYVLSEVVTTRDSPACMSGYPAYTQFSFLNSKNAPLEPAELQARIGFGERGVIENGSITESDGPEGWAFNVKVGSPKENGPAVSFNWTPSNMGAARSACLSYSVNLPREFNFSQGGYLPGLFGELSKTASSTQTGFGARPIWVANGAFQMDVNTSQSAIADGGRRIAAKEFSIPRGRWVRIDQEVVLNTPNVQDGQLKVWVDGRLMINEKKLAWRSHSGIRISGVAADIGYSKINTNNLPPRQLSVIKFSPPQIAWKTEEAKTSSK